MRVPKTLLSLALLAACVLAAKRLLRPLDAPAPPDAPRSSEAGDPPDIVETRSAEVFRRAFWRHPAPEDRILQAELRQWIDAGEVSRWSWHLRFLPGPELRDALLTARIYPLRKIRKEELAERLAACPRPDWAPGTADEPVPMMAGSLLLLQGNDGVWYAEDHGNGFAKPAR